VLAWLHAAVVSPWHRSSIRTQLLIIVLVIELAAALVAGVVTILKARTSTRVEIEASMRLAQLFVADAMTGQDAVKSAEEFHKQLGITGVILTKMDGDARGGAALSIRDVTGQPLKFVGVGEKPDAFEPFHPDRAAQRILDALPEPLLGHRRYRCGNDMVCAWAGSLGGEDGINIVAGTGSIGYGERRGEIGFLAAVVTKLEEGRANFQSGNSLHKPAPVGAAPKLAVGHDFEPDLLLHAHHLADAVVLDANERVIGDLPARAPPERLTQWRRPEQAAHMIGAKRRSPACGNVHGSSPFA